MKNLKNFMVAILALNMVFGLNLKAFACKAARDSYRASTEGHHRFPWEAVALGTTYSVSGTHYALYNIIHDIPKLKKWGEISKFDEKIVVDNDSMSSFWEDYEIPVRLLKNSVNKTNISLENKIEDKTFFVENFDIKNNALHLHYIKVPEELIASNHKLVAETTFVYDNNDSNFNLNFGFFKNARLRHLESIAGKKQAKALKIKENSNIFCIKKEYSIKSTDKSFILAVYSPQSKKAKKDSLPYNCGKYVAFVKFRAVN